MHAKTAAAVRQFFSTWDSTDCGLPANIAVQPGAGISPEPFRGSNGQPDRLGGFLHSHSDKVPKLDQFGSLGVMTRQAVQGLMNRQQLVRGGAEDQGGFVVFLSR